MMTTLDDSLEHSLALNCACGLSVRAWAKRNCVEFPVAMGEDPGNNRSAAGALRRESQNHYAG